MSSDYYNTMLAGYRETVRQFGTIITVGALTARAIASRPIVSEFLSEHGYLPEHDTEIELLRTEFTRLEIEDRTELTMNALTFVVIGIGDDDADPCVMLRCKAAR
jgi:hypothetical protein